MSAAHHHYHRHRAAGDDDAVALLSHCAGRQCTCSCPRSSAPTWPDRRSSVSDRCHHLAEVQLQKKKKIGLVPLQHLIYNSPLTFRQIETHKDVEQQLHTDERSTEAIGRRQRGAKCCQCRRLWEDAAGQWMSARMCARARFEWYHL